MLLLMLLLVGDSRRRAVYAVKLGHDPIQAVADAWYGNPAIDHEGAAPVIAEQMALTEIDGMKRAFRLAGSKVPPMDDATFDRIATGYAAEAREVADATWTVIQSKLVPAYAASRSQGVNEAVKAIRLAFKDAGVTKDDSSTLERGIERQVVQKFNVGLWRGANTIIDPKHHLVGFKHASVIDDGTTDICRERDGLTLPPEDPYWRTNWPGLHWGCRSIAFPLFGESIQASTRLPTIPPAPGFGLAPFRDLGSYFNVVR